MIGWFNCRLPYQLVMYSTKPSLHLFSNLMIFNAFYVQSQFKMLSFGQLKNLLKRFNDCNRTMSILSHLNYPSSYLEQRQMKQEKAQFYLQVIHYVLIEYSAELYKTILELFPNIKAMDDLKFVRSSIAIGRRLLGMNPLINEEKILMDGKWTEKKLEFLVELAEGVGKWQAEMQKKKGKGGGGELKNFMKEPEPISKYLPQNLGYPQQKDAFQSNEESDDEDILVQREITVKPTAITPIVAVASTLSKGSEQSRVGSSSFSQAQKQQVPRPTKPNVFPKGLKQSFAEQQQEQDENEFIQTAKIPTRRQEQPQAMIKPKQQVVPPPAPQTKKVSATHPPPAQQESMEYVTKQQFNEVLEMLASINGTVTGLVTKFNNFQANVTGWFNNTNARLVLLEENVKMIKENL